MKNNTDDAYDMVINKTCIYYYLMSYTAHYRAYRVGPGRLTEKLRAGRVSESTVIIPTRYRDEIRETKIK